MPICEPVNETAGSPQSMMAMHSSAMEIRSPEVSSMSISRADGLRDSLAWRSRSSVVLPMADDDDHDVVTAASGAHDVLGDGTDSIGVGDRGSAELLDQQAHGT